MFQWFVDYRIPGIAELYFKDYINDAIDEQLYGTIYLLNGNYIFPLFVSFVLQKMTDFSKILVEPDSE